jgi:hypothetical protein
VGGSVARGDPSLQADGPHRRVRPLHPPGVAASEVGPSRPPRGRRGAPAAPPFPSPPFLQRHGRVCEISVRAPCLGRDGRSFPTALTKRSLSLSPKMAPCPPRTMRRAFSEMARPIQKIVGSSPWRAPAGPQWGGACARPSCIPASSQLCGRGPTKCGRGRPRDRRTAAGFTIKAGCSARGSSGEGESEHAGQAPRRRPPRFLLGLGRHGLSTWTSQALLHNRCVPCPPHRRLLAPGPPPPRPPCPPPPSGHAAF